MDMYFGVGIWSFSIFIISLVCGAEIQPFPYSYCGAKGNYTANSTYQSNLMSALAYLRLHPVDQGITYLELGDGTGLDNVIVSGDCNRDLLFSEDCGNCIANVTTEIVHHCPLSREAILWDENCILRYSNADSFQKLSMDRYFLYYDTSNVSADIEAGFINHRREDLKDLLDNLGQKGNTWLTSHDHISAWGTFTMMPNTTIYVILQCSSHYTNLFDCVECLALAIQSLDNIPPSRGARVLYLNCWVRYETYSFYNETRMSELDKMSELDQIEANLPRGSKTKKAIIFAIVFAVAVVVLLGGGWKYYIYGRKGNLKALTNDDDMKMLESLKYDVGKIKASTNDFSRANELGNGGFGVVYKGTLENIQEIAVKRLSIRSTQGDMEFKNEVVLLAKLQHRNLVRLLGFAMHGSERLLIYEYLNNGSLNNYIFNPERRTEINWEKRYKIIRGIVKGLQYLHEDSQFRIIHCDLKPSNILLDNEMNPKIADFGLARMFELGETEISANKIVGTCGYMAPEYAAYGKVSIKIDVFSFGVLVLEIISGQKNNSFTNEENGEDMLSFAWRNWREGTIENMIDPTLNDSSTSLQEVMRCIHIALSCVQGNAAERPTMVFVAHILENSSTVIPPPGLPYFGLNTLDSNSMGFNQYNDIEAVQVPINDSLNQISISVFQPR